MAEFCKLAVISVYVILWHWLRQQGTVCHAVLA